MQEAQKAYDIKKTVEFFITSYSKHVDSHLTIVKETDMMNSAFQNYMESSESSPTPQCHKHFFIVVTIYIKHTNLNSYVFVETEGLNQVLWESG